jgi:hypothetical protein
MVSTSPREAERWSSMRAELPWRVSSMLAKVCRTFAERSLRLLQCES